MRLKPKYCQKIVHQALSCAAQCGRIVALGCARGLTDGINFYTDVHRRGVTIIGGHNCIRPEHDSYPGYWTLQDDRQTYLDLLASGRLMVQPLVSEVLSPQEAPAAYDRLASGTLEALGVVFDWRGRKAS